MADRNFNQGSQSHQSNQDWEKDRNRNNQESDWMQNRNKGQYGNTGYSSNENHRDVGYSGDSARGMGAGNEGDVNRVNYLPDNDDNRGYQNRDFGNTPYGSSGGYRGNDRNEDWRQYGNENRGSYGNTSYGNDYGRQDRNRRNENMGGWNNEMDRNRRQQSSSNWDNDYGRQDWGRGQVNTSGDDSNRDYGNRNYGNNYGSYGNMNNDYNRDFGNTPYGSSGGYRGNDRDYRRDDDNNWWDRTKDKVSGWFNNDDDDRRDRNRSYTSYRGKGPSDYRRSEDRIREDICDRLTDDDRVDASNISVQMDGDAVILSGTVNSREEKRRAEDLVESISGVRNVENRLRVGSTSGMKGHDYTGNTDRTGGIGTESGTTNEVIRNVENERNTGTNKGRGQTM